MEKQEIIYVEEELVDIEITEGEPSTTISEEVKTIDVEAPQEAGVDVGEGFGDITSGNGEHSHPLLYGRDLSDQHPISAITGLKEKLQSIESLKTVCSDKQGFANYYKWHKDAYDEYGYFVSLVPGTTTIKICEGTDIFGVTIDAAGFVGGQDEIIPRDNKYALVATTGLVNVRCELGVEVGSYIVPNRSGVAEPTDSECGYKVVATPKINGEVYATISLGVQACTTDLMGQKIQRLDDRLGEDEKNIVAAMQVANEAFQKAGESANISDEALKDALEALKKTEEIEDVVADAITNVENISTLSAQAKAISESAVTSAEAIRKEAVATANDALLKVSRTQDDLGKLVNEMTPLTQWEGENGSGIVGFVARANADSATLASLAEWKEDEGGSQSIAGTIAKVNEHEAVLEHITNRQGVNGPTIAQIEQKADDNSASITSLVASVDKYSVGEFSQAYGLTREQAKSILKPGYIYIPTDNFDKCCDAHKNGPSHCETFLDDGEVNDFTPGDYYVWGINDQGKADWIEHSVGSVWISNAIPSNSNGTLKYWYIGSNTAPQGYEAYALYIWEDDEWKRVNTLAGNASNRAVSMIRQTTNKIAAEVTNAYGGYAGLNARLEADNQAQATMIASVVNPDGTVNTASIVNAVNDSGSSVTINGDHIVLNGATTNGDGSFRIHKDGYMVAKGGTIGGWKINNNYLYSINTKEDDSGVTDGQIATVSGMSGVSTCYDDRRVVNKKSLVDSNTYSNIRFFAGAPYPGDDKLNNNFNIGDGKFLVLEDGSLYASAAKIEGEITATSGEIGGCEIDSNGNLWIPSGNVDVNGVINAGSANIKGLISADYVAGLGCDFKTGSIGGWKLDSNSLYSGSSFGSGSFLCTGSTGSDGKFSIGGSDKINGWVFKAGKNFGVTTSGTTYCGDIHINGGTFGKGAMFDDGGAKFHLFDKDSAHCGIIMESCNKKFHFNGEDNYNPASQIRMESEVILLSVGKTSIAEDGDMPVNTFTEVGGIAIGADSSTIKGTAYTSSSMVITSDKRLKHSVELLGEKYNALFDNLKPVRFKYNDGTSDRYHTGLIAQDVAEAIDEAGLSTQEVAAYVVRRSNEEDEYCGIRYEEFIALLIQQVQDLKGRVSELEQKLKGENV